MSVFSKIKSSVSEMFSPQPIIRFKCCIPGYEIGQPVKRAMDVKPDWMIKQLKDSEKNNTTKFSSCPGMHDYYRTGYIIPAWEDFEIVVNDKTANIKIVINYQIICAPF
jgi:hypothetical protein